MERIEALKAAIFRYTNADLQVPGEWLEEYNDLLRLLQTK
jgi:hypothetical protein